MKLYGSLSRLVSVIFRKDSQDITLQPNQSTTYTASRAFQLAPGDSSQVLVSADATQTLTNKTISGASNTITNVSLTTGVTGVLPIANGGTNSNSSLSNNRVMKSSGGAIVEAAAITAARALISDSNGIPTHSTTTDTELGYVHGVTSALQTQIDGKASTALNNLTVSGLTSQDLLVASSSSAVVRLAKGSNGQVLTVVGGNVAWANSGSESVFKQTWIDTDGATLAITHNLATADIMIQIYDVSSGDSIEVDSMVRTDTNTLTVSASEAPPSTGWRVLITTI